MGIEKIVAADIRVGDTIDAWGMWIDVDYVATGIRRVAIAGRLADGGEVHATDFSLEREVRREVDAPEVAGLMKFIDMLANDEVTPEMIERLGAPPHWVERLRARREADTTANGKG